MEIIINELSLTGQFENEDIFFNNFDCVLRILRTIKVVKFTLAKKSSFYDSHITDKLKFVNVLKLRSDRARKMKLFLSNLMKNPQSWDVDKKHDCKNNKYFYISKDICDTSLAESCERDKIILSFNHKDFFHKDLEIQKNNSAVNIFNITNESDFLEYLFSNNRIESLEYCKLKFKKAI